MSPGPTRPRPGRAPIATALAAAALAAATAAPGCAAKTAGPTRMVFAPPGPGAEAPPRDQKDIGELHRWAPIEVPSEESATARPGPFTVSLRLLERAARRQWVGDAIGRDVDPFAATEKGPAHLTILMTVRNDSPQPLVFNPQSITLVTDRQDRIQPLDATRAYAAMKGAGLDPDRYLGDLQRVLFDTAVSLQPSESVTRLLAYPPPGQRVELARLDFNFFAVGNASYSFRIPMRRAPVPPEAGPPEGDR